jgi:ribosomal protein L4
VSFLKTFGVEKNQKVLLVTATRKDEVIKAFANLPLSIVKPVNEINTYLLLWSEIVIMEKEAFLKLVEVHGGER